MSNCRTPKPLPSQEELLALLRYEPETGKLFWRRRPKEWFSREMDWKTWNTKFSDKEACACPHDGYLRGRILDVEYRAHRVIFKMVYGTEPNQIDHIDGVRSHNLIDNMRAADPLTNRRNQQRNKNNKSGVMGVSWVPDRQKWQAQIKVRGTNIPLGRYTDKNVAVAVRLAAEKRYGFHPNHNREAQGATS